MSTVPRKTGKLSKEEEQIYERIRESISSQREEYKKFLADILGEEKQKEQQQLAARWGFNLDVQTGRIKYSKDFMPIDLPYDVIYVRHGKTEGNTEPRIYQGDVDYWENQLTDVGKEQAKDAANRIEELMQQENWRPDLIVLSPLGRACETAKPFMIRHPEIPSVKNEGTKEQAFGCYDNVRVIDVPDNSIAHLFYLEQNALFKAEKDHVCGKGFAGRQEGEVIPAESFVDLIDRLGTAMKNLEFPTAKNGKRPQILFFDHSMAGAAVSMLLGHGKCDENGCLCFDGKYIMPNATPTKLPAVKP